MKGSGPRREVISVKNLYKDETKNISIIFHWHCILCHSYFTTIDHTEDPNESEFVHDEEIVIEPGLDGSETEVTFF